MTVMKTQNVNGTFSGTDIVAMIVFPECKPIAIGELTTATYSVYREKHPVRVLSRISVKGFTKGPRTVAGTLIFTVFEKHILNRIRTEVPYLKDLATLKVDELPPFDLYLTMGNEYGASSRLNIYGMTIVDEGKVFSVEDMFTENTWSYMARDIVLMDDLGAEQNRPLTQWDSGESTGAFTTDDLVLDDKYKAMLAEIAKLKADREAAIGEARALALTKYTATYDAFDYEEMFYPVEESVWTPSPEIDPDKIFHPEMKMSHRYFTGAIDKFFERSLEAKSPNNRVVAIYLDVKDLSKSKSATASNGVPVTLSLTLGTYKKSLTVSFKDGHVIIEIERFYEWTPEICNISIVVGKDFTTSGVKYNLLSTSPATLKNDGDAAKFGSKLVFSYGKAGGAAETQLAILKGLKIGLQMSVVGRAVSALATGELATQVWRDALGPNDGKQNWAKMPGRADSYITSRWLTPNFVPSPYNSYEVLNGFTFKWNITKNGTKSGFTKAELKLFTMKCSYKLAVTIKSKSTGKEVRHVVDGNNANGNLAFLSSTLAYLRSGITFPEMNIIEMYNQGSTVYPNDSFMHMIGNVGTDAVQMAVNSSKGEVAIYDLCHSDVEIILYNFQVVYIPTGTNVPTTPNFSQIRWDVADMTTAKADAKLK